MCGEAIVDRNLRYATELEETIDCIGWKRYASKTASSYPTRGGARALHRWVGWMRFDVRARCFEGRGRGAHLWHLRGQATGCFDASTYVFDRGMRVADESGMIVDVGEVACGKDLKTGHDVLACERVDAPHGSRCSDRSDGTVCRENCGTCGGKLQDSRRDHPWAKVLGRPICHPSICR